jgi:hypothetical protein
MKDYKPGIYDNISHVEYNEMPPSIVRNSYLNDLDYCPAKAKMKPDPDKPESPSLLLGRAAHSLVLEGEVVFNNEFAVAPTCDRRRKEGRAIWDKVIADNPGKSVVTQEDYVKILGMRAAVKSHPFAGKLLAQGLSEQTVIWEDEETGILCRCRPDRVPTGHNILIDFKGTKDASSYGFDKAIANYRYYRQAAMYLEGISKATGEKYEAFTLVGVEWEFPHRTIVKVIDKDYLAWGRKEFHDLLVLEAQCREKDFWPHYNVAGAEDSFLPGYLGL